MSPHSTLRFQLDDHVQHNGSGGSNTLGVVTHVTGDRVSINFVGQVSDLSYYKGSSGYDRISLVLRNPFDLAPIS